MGPNGPCSELIFLVGTTYEGWMSVFSSFLCKRAFGNYVRLHKDKGVVSLY